MKSPIFVVLLHAAGDVFHQRFERQPISLHRLRVPAVCWPSAGEKHPIRCLSGLAMQGFMGKIHENHLSMLGLISILRAYIYIYILILVRVLWELMGDFMGLYWDYVGLSGNILG